MDHLGRQLDLRNKRTVLDPCLADHPIEFDILDGLKAYPEAGREIPRAAEEISVAVADTGHEVKSAVFVARPDFGRKFMKRSRPHGYLCRDHLSIYRLFRDLRFDSACLEDAKPVQVPLAVDLFLFAVVVPLGEIKMPQDDVGVDTFFHRGVAFHRDCAEAEPFMGEEDIDKLDIVR